MSVSVSITRENDPCMAVLVQSDERVIVDVFV